MENREYVQKSDIKNFDWSTVGLDFGNWDEEKLWAMELPTQDLDVSELLWHFDVPFWTNDDSERWSVTMRDVVEMRSGTSTEQERTAQSDLSYPIDIMENHGRWLVLDGLHRLVKTYQQGLNTVKVRIVPRDRFDEIKSEYPMELPNN